MSLNRLLEARGLFEITCFILKIHENFAFYFWTCFNVTLCVKLLSVRINRCWRQMPEYPCDFAICRQNLGDETAIRFVLLPALLPSHSGTGGSVSLWGAILSLSLSIVRLCPLSWGWTCNSGSSPLRAVTASGMTV